MCMIKTNRYHYPSSTTSSTTNSTTNSRTVHSRSGNEGEVLLGIARCRETVKQLQVSLWVVVKVSIAVREKNS